MGRQSSVAIIVASYNHAEYLQQRIESIIAQTHQDIDLLVIDDFSTDGSRIVLDQFAKYPSIRLMYSDVNRGWVQTSNLGVELTSAEFISFCNCDDFCDPQLISSLLKALQDHPTAAVAFCQSSLVDQNGHSTGSDRTHRSNKFKKLIKSDTLIDSETATGLLVESCIIPNLSAALFRRDALIEAGLLSDSYRVVSDWDLFFKIAKKHDIAYVHSTLNSFRQHRTTIRSSTKNRKIYEEYFQLLLNQLQPDSTNKGINRQIEISIMSKWLGYYLIDLFGAIKSTPYFTRFFLRSSPRVFLHTPYAILQLIVNRLHNET
jgi:glycosyltransferase involved in cell wall biosynthesis